MKSEELLRLLGGIDSEYIENARSGFEAALEAREGVSVRAGYPGRRTARTAIASVVGAAAALFGVFVLLLNIGRLRLGGSHGQNSSVQNVSEDVITGYSEVELSLYHKVWGEPDTYSAVCRVRKKDALPWFSAECTQLDNCTVSIRERNSEIEKTFFMPSENKRDLRAETDGEWAYFEVTMTVTDPEVWARAKVVIRAGTS